MSSVADGSLTLTDCTRPGWSRPASRSSINPGLRRANSAISASIWTDSLSRRLWSASRVGIVGNKRRSRLAATAENRASDGIPMIACATHSVTISKETDDECHLSSGPSERLLWR